LAAVGADDYHANDASVAEVSACSMLSLQLLIGRH